MRPRILIVEDTEELLHYLEKYIREMFPEFEILTARNEAEAARLMDQGSPSAIITDVNLSGAGGGERGGEAVLKAAQERKLNRRVVVISSYADLIKKLEGCRRVLRTSDYLEGLLSVVRDTLKISLTVALPEQSTHPIQFSVAPRDLYPHSTRHPLSLESPLLKEAVAGIGALSYLDLYRQQNALSQFVGRYVWEKLFRDHAELLEALAHARALATNPRNLLIRVVSERDALDAPVELLYDGREYVALVHALVRVIRGPSPRAEALPALLTNLATHNEPLRVLLLASDTCSGDLGRIPLVDTEIESIRALIDRRNSEGNRPSIKLCALKSWETCCSVVEKRLSESWDIIHYAGHGIYDEANPASSKLFFWEKSCSETDWRDAKDCTAAVRKLRGELQTLTTNQFSKGFDACPPSVVYLSCCHSARAGSVDCLVHSKSLGLMDAVIRRGVPVVIGHRWPLVDGPPAVSFVRTFYKQLLSGHTPDQAILSARQSVEDYDATWASAVMVLQSV